MSERATKQPVCLHKVLCSMCMKTENGGGFFGGVDPRATQQCGSWAGVFELALTVLGL